MSDACFPAPLSVRHADPGGWLLLEEAEPLLRPLVCPDDFGAEQALAIKLKRGFRSLHADRGVDIAF